jgi:hypothetical protein
MIHRLLMVIEIRHLLLQQMRGAGDFSRPKSPA